MLTHTIRFTNSDLMNKISCLSTFSIYFSPNYWLASDQSAGWPKQLWGNNWDWDMCLLYGQHAVMLDVCLSNSLLHCRALQSQTFQLIRWGQIGHYQTLCWCYGIEELRKQQLLAVKLHGLVQNTKGNGAMKRDKITKRVEYGENSAVIKKLTFSMIKNHRQLKVSYCTP